MESRLSSVSAFAEIHIPFVARKHPAARTIPFAKVEDAVCEVMLRTDEVREPAKVEDAVEVTERFWVDEKVPPVRVMPLDEERPADATPPAKLEVPDPCA